MGYGYGIWAWVWVWSDGDVSCCSRLAAGLVLLDFFLVRYLYTHKPGLSGRCLLYGCCMGCCNLAVDEI